MATSIRFPRPLGITAMALEYKKQKDPKLLQSLHNYLINIWTMSNNTLCGVPYETNAFSLKFNIPLDEIKNYMRDRLMSTKFFNPENQEQILNGMLTEQLMWALDDRNEIVQQVNLLKAAQGGKYTPFISAELNKALKLRIDSSNSLQMIIKNMMGGGTTNIFAQFNQQNNITNTQNSVTIEEARALILESNSTANKNDEAKLLETTYDLASLPEVIANNQQGVDTSKEALGINKVELNSIMDNYKGSIEVADQEHHEQRREIMMGIDPEDEDPELDTYLEEDDEEEPEGGYDTFNFLVH